MKYRQEIGSSSSRNAGFGGGRTVVFKGAALMGAAALISKALGTLQKIPLQNIAGDRVFGIYNAVAPLYQLLLAIVSSGFPVAISILVAEREVHGDRIGAGRILGASAMLLFGYGVVLFIPMWGGADVVAAWIGDSEAAQAIRMSALALWVVPAMAALRGYYQGRNEMLPSAASQLSEQTVRVAGMLALLAVGWHYGWGDAKLAAGATAGSAIGGTAGLAVMVGIWLRERARYRYGTTVIKWSELRRLGEQSGQEVREALDGQKELQEQKALKGQKELKNHSTGGLMRRLIMLAIPVTFGALAVPVLGVVDSFTVPRLLRAAGDGQAEAMALFGLYSRGQPLVQLVVMVAGAMGTALVPALAAARLHRDEAGVKQHATIVLRFAWALGAAAAIGLAALAEPINVMLYADDEGTRTFALVGCTALAGTVSALTAAVLQGLGAVRAPALFMLAAAALKAALNAALVPALGIAGAACAGIAALTAAALLGTGAVRRAAGAALPARRTAGIALALAVMAAVLVPAERGAASLLGPLPPRAAAAALALGGVALGGAVFLAAVLRFGGLTARELRALPGGGALAAKLQQLRLLPRGD